MSIAFVRRGWMLFVTTECAAELSVCMGVLGCGCPNSSRVFLAGTASLAFMYIAPISASHAEDITARMICHNVSTGPLFGGICQSLDMKKCPPALLQALGSLKYDASLWIASTKHCWIYRSCIIIKCSNHLLYVRLLLCCCWKTFRCVFNILLGLSKSGGNMLVWLILWSVWSLSFKPD